MLSKMCSRVKYNSLKDYGRNEVSIAKSRQIAPNSATIWRALVVSLQGSSAFSYICVARISFVLSISHHFSQRACK